MIEILARNWWLVVLRGVLAILFGLAAVFWPALTLFVLVIMFGIYAVVDGVIAAWTGLSRAKDSARWWVFLLEGLISIVAGVIALIWPSAAALAIVLLVGSWAILTGVFEIAAAIRLRREIKHEWLLGLGGLVSIILGVLMFIWPDAGAVAILWTIGIYAQIFGVLLVALGIRLKGQQLPRGREPRLA